MQTTPRTPSASAETGACMPVIWHIQGKGVPVVILPDAHVRWDIWDDVLRHWSQHYQLLLPSCATAAVDADLLQSMTVQAGASQRQPPLYLIGLHEAAALACQLAAQLPHLSGLVLLYDQRHGCNWSSAAPGSDTLPMTSHPLPPHIPVLTVWLNAPGQTEPADAVLTLTQNHSQHEWMVLSATSSPHTIAQCIHSWMQSHA